jgi:hypothetical protein
MRRLPRVALLLAALPWPGSAQEPVRTLPDVLVQAERADTTAVELEMRGVRFRPELSMPLMVHYLRGTMAPARAGHPPWLEDRASFLITVDTAQITVGMDALAAIFNEHVMNYEGAPLSRLALRGVDGRLEIRGRLHGIGFAMLADADVAPDGRLRLRPSGVEVLGVGVRGLMRRLGIALDDVIEVRRGRGIEVRDHVLLLQTGDLVPPPRLAGRLTSVTVLPGVLRLAFGRSARGGAPPLAHEGPPGRNYICHHGGVLKFGKLTMGNAELEIVDADPRDPFDLHFKDFNRQLVAGVTRNRPDFGLFTVMPDLEDLP